MKKNDEKLFDDAIRKKLIGEEEVAPAYVWENVKNVTGRGWFRVFYSSLNGFLFQDIILLLLMPLFFSNTSAVTIHESAKIGHHVIPLAKDLKMKEIFSTANDKAIATNETTGNDKIIRITDKGVKNIEVMVKSNSRSYIASKYSKQIENKIQKSGSGVDELINQPHFKDLRVNSYRQLASIREAPPVFKASIYKKNTLSLPQNKKYLQKNKLTDENVALLKGLPVIGFFEMEIPESDVIDDNVNGKASDLPIPDNNGVSPVSFSVNVGTSYFVGDLISKETAIEIQNKKHVINGWNASLMMDYSIAEKWNLSIGIQHTYANLNYQLKTSTLIADERIDTIHGWIIFPFDPPIPVTTYDTVEFNRKVISNTNPELRMHVTNLVIQVSRLFNKNKFTYGLHAGMLFNLSNSVKNSLPENANMETGVVQQNKELLKKQFGIGFFTGGEIGYKLSPHLTLFINLRYERFANDVAQKSSLYHLYLSQLNTGIGLRWMFLK